MVGLGGRNDRLVSLAAVFWMSRNAPPMGKHCMTPKKKRETEIGGWWSKNFIHSLGQHRMVFLLFSVLGH